MPSRLNRCCIKMFEFSFEKNVQNWTKTNKKRAEEYMEKKVPIILGNRI